MKNLYKFIFWRDYEKNNKHIAHTRNDLTNGRRASKGRG